jgi:aminoglycoside 3-N-acetyltransferase
MPNDNEPDNTQSAATCIANDLLAIGLRPGGVALLHSSLSSLGYVIGGAETVIRGLLQALGPTGTLLMPALSYEYATALHPYFDVRRTPSNVGLIPETFRTRAGTLRSVCPTHSVCGVGPLATILLGEHHLDDTPCGPHSPYRLLPAYDGQIVFLGCSMRRNTSMHSVEEIAAPPYLWGCMLSFDVTLADGTQRAKPCRSHDFTGYAQRYERVADLLDANALHSGTVMAALTHIIDSAPMWAAALMAYRRNPLWFVEARTGEIGDR